MGIRIIWMLLAVLAVPVPGLAQEPVPAEANTPPAVEAGPSEGAFIYNPEGRRDPFVSLFQRGAELEEGAAAGVTGVGALTVQEVALRGVLQTPQGYVALVEGADARTYIVRSGDLLRDGTVERIASEDMVIRQQINDPLSAETEREVRKTLRQTEEAVP